MSLVDPRIPRLADTVNGRLVDRAIRHAVFLERLKTHQAQKLTNFYRKHVFPDLLKEYEGRIARAFYKGADPGPWTTKRIKEVIASAHHQMRVGTKVALGEYRKDLGVFVVNEADWQVRALSESVPSAFGLDFRSPSPVLMRTLVDNNPFEGRLTKKWFADLSTGLKVEAQKQVTIGLAAGETLPKIVRRLRGAVDMTARHAETIVRTSINHVSNIARQATYAENTDVIKGWQFIATLDSRTTEICMATDGLTFPIGEGAHSQPPLHHRCRSGTAPVLKSWDELGIKGLKEAPPGARATMTGLVPAKQSYGGWLREQPRWIQDQALGPKKAKLFRRGKVPISRFVDSGRTLTIKQLEEIEKRLGGHPPKKPMPARKAKRPAVKNGKQVRQDIERRLDTVNREIDSALIRQQKYSDKLEPFYKEFGTAMGSPKAQALALKFDKATEDLLRLTKIRRTVAQDVLKVKDPINIDLKHNYKFGRGRNKEYKLMVEESRDYLSSITSRKKIDRINVEVSRIPKISDDRPYQYKGDIFLRDESGFGTVIHELGHTLESNSHSWFRDRAVAFLKMRVAREGPGSLDGIRTLLRDLTGIKKYKSNEFAWKDKFIDAYMGKDYGKWATELISMGVELLYKNPEFFIKKDPEMFEWLINMLRGID